jgi:hypothetical protein
MTQFFMGDLPIEHGAFSMDAFVLLEGKQEHPEEHQTHGWLVVWNIFFFSIYWECHHPT